VESCSYIHKSEHRECRRVPSCIGGQKAVGIAEGIGCISDKAITKRTRGIANLVTSGEAAGNTEDSAIGIEDAQSGQRITEQRHGKVETAGSRRAL
jgi:hypothetical protein